MPLGIIRPNYIKFYWLFHSIIIVYTVRLFVLECAFAAMFRDPYLFHGINIPQIRTNH